MTAPPATGADAARAIRARRAAAQMLSGPRGSGASEIVGRLLAVPAQDLRAAPLALRARGAALTAGEVERATGGEPALVIGWLMRGTLHLVRREDYPWLLALTAPARRAASRRRLGQEGVSEGDAQRAVAVVERALAEEGPLTSDELAERIAAHGVRTAGQATRHLLMRAALQGVAVLGALRAGRPALVLVRDVLGADLAGWSSVDRDAALGELARRYLAAHGPATAADLAGWAGLPRAEARAGLARISAEIVEHAPGMVDLRGRDPAPGRAEPRLLPAFDPYLLGWRDRAFAVPPHHARQVHPGGGVLRAVATVDGRAVGTWSARRREGLLAVEVDLFCSVDAEAAAALRAEAADVARFERRALAVEPGGLAPRRPQR